MPEYNNQNNNQRKLRKKLLIVILVLVIVFSSVIMTRPQPAQAFIDFNQGIFNIFKIPYDVLSRVYEVAQTQFAHLSAVAYKNAIQTFMSRLAYRSATQMATGGPGGKPTFKVDFGKMLKEEADGAVGDYLNYTVGKMWGKDLCLPLDPLAKINIELAVKSTFEPPKPQCKVSKIYENISNLKDLKLNQLIDFSQTFNPSSNDLGAFLTITTGAIQERNEREETRKLLGLMEGEWEPIKGLVDDTVVRTPAGLQGAYYAGMIHESLQPYGVYTGDAIADAIGVFTNTLTSKLLEHMWKGIFDPKDQPGSGLTGLGGSYSPAFGGSKQAAKERFADLGQPDYRFGGAVDVLDNLSCDSQHQFSCTIDTQFRTALEQEDRLTVRQAIDQGLIHGDWPVGYRPNKSGGTDGVKSGIYSYRSLVILRKYRIIPVTWELAASYYKDFDRSNQPLTLNRLISEYNNPASPYYRLVDPAWVVKAPVTLCMKEGPGEEVLDTFEIQIDKNQDGQIKREDGEIRESPVRKEYCADERSCIKEDNNGNCEYYGYCTKEKPIWRIQGDGCDAVYSSCRAYINRDGQRVAYLHNTLSGKNGEPCDAANVGCREYCTDWDNVNNTWSCQVDIDPAVAGARMYLNKNASDNECTQEEVGCSQFVRMSSVVSQPSNWIPNPSFEEFEGDSAVQGDGFNPGNHNTSFVTSSSGGTYYTDSSYDGDYALEGGFSIDINIDPNNSDNVSLAGRIFTLSIYYQQGDVNLSLNGDPSPTFDTASDEWLKASVTKVYDIGLLGNNDVVSVVVSGSAIIDSVSLVEADSSSDRNYTEVNQVNLLKAPEDYDCENYTVIIDGDESSCTGFWREDIQKCVAGGSYECANYALHCSAEDSDCRFYKPVSYSGPSVPGVARANDFCPAECVGYRTYMEQASFFDNIVTPVNLIALTAQTCSASENGCEEFTNLSEGPEGERKEYYTNLRACVLEGNTNIATYYSWASSEEAGNQLRSWRLLKSDPGEFPCTNTKTAADGTVTCVDGVVGGLISRPQKCKLGDPDPENNPVYNPDCIEFTAASGISYWMKYSHVVFASDECVPLRRTVDQSIYSAIPRLSQTCSANAVGCREYKGSASNNIEIILQDDFENGTDQDWNGGTNSPESLIANGHSLSAGGTINKVLGTLINQGSSYKLSFWAKSDDISPSISSIEFSSGGFFDNSDLSLNDYWDYYEVSLINLATTLSDTEELIIASANSFYIDNIILTQTRDDLYLIKDSWNTPVSCEEIIDGRDMVGCEHYQDNNNQDWYLRSFDRLCRDEIVGCELMINMQNTQVPFSQSFNGLSVNADTRDDVDVLPDDLIYLVYDEQKSCSNVGCTALGLIKPQRDNSIQFSTKYLIVNPDDYGQLSSPLCLSNQVWCDEFRPISSPGTPEYFKNPNVFVCEYKEVSGNYAWYEQGSSTFCQGVSQGYCSNNLYRMCVSDAICGSGYCSFNYGYCSNDYNRRCLDGAVHCNGAPCIVNRYCIGGRSMLNDKIETNICGVGDECTQCIGGSDKCIEGGVCTNWVGLCPENQDSCTEYQDPSMPENCDKQSVNGETDSSLANSMSPDSTGSHCDFYYYESDSITTCDNIDPNQGCLPLHEAGGGKDVWYSTARCTGDLNIACESDADCMTLNAGRCTYTPRGVKKQIYIP